MLFFSHRPNPAPQQSQNLVALLRWQLVVVNPSMVLGPPTTGRPDGQSVDLIRKGASNKFYPACPEMGECVAVMEGGREGWWCKAKSRPVVCPGTSPAATATLAYLRLYTHRGFGAVNVRYMAPVTAHCLSPYTNCWQPHPLPNPNCPNTAHHTPQALAQ